MATRSRATKKIPVSFSDASIGDQTASIGFTVDRSQLTINQAEEFFCGRRLTGTIEAKPKDEHPEQAHLNGFEGHAIKNSFDIKRFSTTPKNYSGRLTFSLQEIELADLAHLAQRDGQITVTEISDADHDGDGE